MLNNLAETVNIPRKYVNDICLDLEKAKLITRVDSEEIAFQPGFDIHKMDIHSVVNKLEKEGDGRF